MTREQIQKLHFRKKDGELASVQAACRRLTILTERGYLTRLRLPVTRGSGPYVYHPDKAAAAILDEEDAKHMRQRVGRRRIESVATVAHGLEIVDFYVTLKEALESRGGEIITWLGDREVRYQFTWHGRRLLFNPDAYCLWAFGDHEHAFFLEWDRGTESMTRLSEKLARYDAYFRLRAHHDHLGDMGMKPRLLIVAPDARRGKKMVEWIDRRRGKEEYPALPTILVSIRDLVYRDVVGPIWHTPGDEHRMSLVD